MTSVGDPLVGHLLDGRYQITRRLARGGMATVYTAVDNRLTRTVAVKVMHVGLGDDAEFARKFDREARSAARLSHPNVVSVFDQGHDEGRPYIVMEYVDGHTLRDVINAEAPLTPLRALEITEPVLSALACAHEAGLVHRDVKPENVLINGRGQIKVADFGLAKAITSQSSTATQGLLIGTVSYLPPELVLNASADARSDVYSAGIVLFELLTGRKPHTGETPIQVAYAHVHADVPPPSTLPTAGFIPPYLDALVGRATSRDADLRPHDARVLLSQVRRVRAAVRDGLADDPELTQDLSSVRPTPGGRAAADGEVTQLVPAPQVVRREVAAPVSPPTFRDAAPPVVIPAPHPDHPPGLSPERLAGQREREARRRRRGWLALLVVLMLTTIAALAGWYLTEGRFTSAPALSALEQDEAAAVAAGVGLQVAFSTAFSETVEKGVVISTHPGPGVKLIDGGTITAVVSKGPERFVMPTVTGLSRRAALAALAEANLKVGTVRETYSETVSAGLVSAVSHKAGERLRRGTSVDLAVSKGPKPIKITSYTGERAGAARAALTKAGFKVKITSANSDKVAAGLVIAQKPGRGTGFRGDTVTIKQSLGPVMVTIPNVRSMGVKAATAEMEKVGFKVVVKPVAVNYIGVGYVVFSRPAAAKQAPKGSTVTLYVV